MEENWNNTVKGALTTDEIRLKAHNWTLAGDVGLLAHLEQFSQDLFNRSRETQKNINSLLDSFEDTSTTLNNVTNQFLALQNSQFVENRVYDDESPVEEEKSEPEISKEDRDKQLLAQYKEAVEIGVKLLDTHFEEVQLPPNSDSDEEISIENSGLVWKPKNPYAGKRFPLLIGSAEWWADDHVGLGEYEENINPDIVSSESESDMEAEGTAEKRIRMSSSSSTESDKIMNKKLKPKEEINPGYESIFTLPNKDMAKVESNLFKEDDFDERKSPSESGEPESIKSLSLPSAADNKEKDIVNSYSSKQNSSSLFDDNEEEDSDEDYGPASTVPVAKENKLPNAFTKELAAKLSSVAKKDVEGPKSKDVLHTKTESSNPSALFDENDDNDDLFSAKNSDVLFKKPSIFSDGDADDQLFGDSDGLFSSSKKTASVKSNVKVTESQGSESSATKDNNSSILFDARSKITEDDLFGNNDDLLFSRKSTLGSSHNSGGAGNNWREAREVRFSTPTEKRDNPEVPHSDIFGGVSEIRSNNSSRGDSVSAISNDMDITDDNSFNFARYLSADPSKDQGFAEPSDVSNNKSGKSESPGLFEPQLSSTRHVPSDTSDYKTHRSSSYQTSQKSISAGRQSQENSRSKMGHTEKAHFSRKESESNKGKGLFADEDEDDDLFQASKEKKPVKNSLFDDIDNDDLFSNLPQKGDGPIFEDNAENSILFKKSAVPNAEVDEEDKSLPTDRVKHQDSISMSSSRSSLFDDVNVGKTNLASVFDNDKPAKTSDDLFGNTEENLFADKKMNLGDADTDDLFSDNTFKSKLNEKPATSLFDDLDDADDLFGDDVTKKIFQNYNDENLFEKPSSKPVEGKQPENQVKLDESEDVDKKPKKVEPSVAASKKSDQLFDDIFGESKSTGDSIFDSRGSKPSEVPNLFEDLEDEEEDLFRGATSKAFKEKLAGGRHSQMGGGDGKDIFNSESSEKETKSVSDDWVREDQEDWMNPKPKDSEKPFESLFGVAGDFDKSDNTEPPDKKDELLISNNKDKTDLFDDKTPKVLENKNLFDDDDDFDDNNLFNNKSVGSKTVHEKGDDGVRPSPPKTLNIVKRLDLVSKQESDPSETDGLSMSLDKPKVGKLNIPTNLKINPMHLLPGAAPKKNVPSEKQSEAPEVSETDRAVTVDQSTETAPYLLKCLSKDRVKIQTRRRPQTRRARQEALRSSGIDFEVSPSEIQSVAARSRSVDDFEKGLMLPPTVKSSSDTNVNDPGLVSSVDEGGGKVLENADSSNSTFHSVENSPEALFSSPLVSNPLSPSTDEEDYFNVPELDVNFEREDQSIFKSNVTDFKSDDKGDDTLLFDGAPVLSPLNPTKTLVEEKKTETVKPAVLTSSGKNLKSSIMVDDEENDDDDDSLFKRNDTKVTRAEDVKKTKNIFDDLDEDDSFLFQKKPDDVLKVKERPKKSLFEDSDEDDDLFKDTKVPSSSVGKTSNNKDNKTKVSKSNVPEKSKEPFVDPLGLMSNPD